LDAQELARKACFVLADLLNGKEIPQKRQILDTKLVIRQSCTSYKHLLEGGELLQKT
jgi:DNA-binding LacI/PurR family transcriptional regulator